MLVAHFFGFISACYPCTAMYFFDSILLLSPMSLVLFGFYFCLTWLPLIASGCFSILFSLFPKLLFCYFLVLDLSSCFSNLECILKHPTTSSSTPAQNGTGHTLSIEETSRASQAMLLHGENP